MSEKYVKEILEKLEEIEKLHGKLRNLVPRVKNYESESSSTAVPKRSINMENKQFVANKAKGNPKNLLPEQKPIGILYDTEIYKDRSKNSTTRFKKLFSPDKSATSFKKFRDRYSKKWRNFKRSSVDFMNKQWEVLSSINQPDVILVSRASQTTDDLINIPSKKRSVIFPRKRSQTFERRSTLQDLSEWLLERFDYFHDRNRVNESTVSIPDRGLGEDEPRKVQKTLIVPDEESETLKIVSSARRVSVDDKRKRSSLGRTRKLSSKYSEIRLEQ